MLQVLGFLDVIKSYVQRGSITRIKNIGRLKKILW